MTVEELDGIKVHTGGLEVRREMDRDNPFEVAIENTLGDWIRSDSANAAAMWGSLANVIWSHKDSGKQGYSFRAAGDLIAAIRDDGDYMDWYCSTIPGIVYPHVSAALATAGFTWEINKRG